MLVSWRRTPRESPNRLRQLHQVALAVAIDEIGNGEIGENNRGPHVMRYSRGRDSVLWCAAFVSYCFEESAWRCDLVLPFTRSLGAKQVTRRIGRAGRFVKRPQPGDVVCWHRRGGGHVGIVEHYGEESDDLGTIEGNRGRYPSEVDRYPYLDGSWRRNLHRIARLW